MRISTKTLIVVLVCLLGAAFSSAVVFYQYKQVEEYRQHRENSYLALREIDHMQTILSQWFITIDLFFAEKQGYLNNSIQKQVPQILNLLKRIRYEIGQYDDLEKQQFFTHIHTNLNTISFYNIISNVYRSHIPIWVIILFRKIDHTSLLY